MESSCAHGGTGQETHKLLAKGTRPGTVLKVKTHLKLVSRLNGISSTQSFIFHPLYGSHVVDSSSSQM